jgi:hypothetical protein
MKSPYPNYKTSNLLLSDHAKDLDIFKGLPFYCGNTDVVRANCCFNHIIGLPEKNDKTYSIFDYELDVIDKIRKHRNIWIKKASGIGCTELILRFLTWRILVNNDLEYKNVFIISGTYVHHANELKTRMENLFRKRFPLIQLESKFTDLWIKNTNIKIFPSRNVKDLRGYTDVSYLFIDEADHFDASVTSELLHAITRYEEKSNCTTIMVSTPNRPGGLFQTIELDPNSKYHKIFLLYEVGLDKIYNREEIEKKKLEPEFPREYMGQYLGRVGNVFTPQQVDDCIVLGNKLKHIPLSQYTLKSVGLDFGFSSSKTAIVMCEHLKDQHKIILRYSKEIDKADPNEIVNLCWNLWKQNGYMNTLFFCDGSNRSMINLLKIRWDESLNWDPSDVSADSMHILPVNFNTEHKNMLSHLHVMMSKGHLAIPEEHDKVLTSLRTAYAEELNLKKDITSYDDLLDGFRLSLKAYNIK